MSDAKQLLRLMLRQEGLTEEETNRFLHELKQDLSAETRSDPEFVIEKIAAYLAARSETKRSGNAYQYYYAVLMGIFVGILGNKATDLLDYLLEATSITIEAAVTQPGDLPQLGKQSRLVRERQVIITRSSLEFLNSRNFKTAIRIPIQDIASLKGCKSIINSIKETRNNISGIVNPNTVLIEFISPTEPTEDRVCLSLCQRIINAGLKCEYIYFNSSVMGLLYAVPMAVVFVAWRDSGQLCTLQISGS